MSGVKDVWKSRACVCVAVEGGACMHGLVESEGPCYGQWIVREGGERVMMGCVMWMVLQAVKQNGNAAFYASEELQGDREIWLEVCVGGA